MHKDDERHDKEQILENDASILRLLFGMLRKVSPQKNETGNSTYPHRGITKTQKRIPHYSAQLPTSGHDAVDGSAYNRGGRYQEFGLTLAPAWHSGCIEGGKVESVER